MLELTFPDRGQLRLEHLVMDVNGTLALAGMLIDGLADRIASIGRRMTIHLLTADTHHRQAIIDQQLNLTATRPLSGDGSSRKALFIDRLGAYAVIAIGQSANDAGMLKAAALRICILSGEGTAPESNMACDIVVPNLFVASDLPDKPMRIVACLRK